MKQFILQMNKLIRNAQRPTEELNVLSYQKQKNISFPLLFSANSLIVPVSFFSDPVARVEAVHRVL